MTGRFRARTTAGTMVLVMVSIGLVAGCAARGEEGHLVGAPPQATTSGPTVIRTPELPALAPRVTTEKSAPTTAPQLQSLVDKITSALADAERVPPNVEVSQKSDAGKQVIVSWIVSTDPGDPSAKENVRRDAVKIMTVVKDSGIDHGSVLLAATGAILQDQKRKVTDVVRAKFTEALVRRTDWAAVPPAIIFTLCDDKPAVIAPAFR